jgi:hypothetical protein
MRALLIGPDEKAKLAALAKLAEEHPVDMPSVMERIKTGEGKHRHMMQMAVRTVEIPMGYSVTFSVEDGHPVGRCRHLSVSLDDPKKAPHPAAVWSIACLLGFWGELCECDGVWWEKLHQGEAINLVQRWEKHES